MRIGFDLDGVLYDFGNSCREYGKSIGLDLRWKDDAHEPHTWNFFESWVDDDGVAWDAKRFVQFCHDGADAGYIFQGDVRPNAVESVERVARLGHEVVIITDRSFGTTPEVSEQATCAWLAQHGIEYDELVFSPDKTIVETDFFVEDKLENYDALRKAGVACYLITRSWNLDPKYGEKDGRYRINDVSDYADTIELYTKWLGVQPSNYALVNA